MTPNEIRAIQNRAGRNRTRQSFANDPVHQRIVEKHELDAYAAEKSLEKWGVLPTLGLYIRVIGERAR